MVVVTVPSVIAQEFPEEQEKYLSFYEVANGLGSMLGPIVTLAITPFVTEYVWQIMTFAGLIGVLNTIAFAFLPKRLDKNPEEEDEDG
jgi:cyanate permease